MQQLLLVRKEFFYHSFEFSDLFTIKGSVTHTVSTGAIVFEMTGQVSYLVPVMIAVLISNAVAAFLQPSFFDSVILIKKLPYLPDLLPRGSAMYNFIVENFMSRDVIHIWRGITYQTLKEILKEHKDLRSFPLVDSPSNMILLGSVRRRELIKMIDQQVGRKKRLQVAALWKQAEMEREEHERMMEDENLLVSTPDVNTLREIANNEMMTPHAKKDAQSAMQPKKSILKKTNSFASPLNSPSAVNSSYATINGSENRFRTAVDKIFRKSVSVQEMRSRHDPEMGSKMSSIGGNEFSSGTIKKVKLPKEHVSFVKYSKGFYLIIILR